MRNTHNGSYRKKKQKKEEQSRIHPSKTSHTKRAFQSQNNIWLHKQAHYHWWITSANGTQMQICSFCPTCTALLPVKLKSRCFWLPQCLRSPTAKGCTILLQSWGRKNTHTKKESLLAAPRKVNILVIINKHALSLPSNPVCSLAFNSSSCCLFCMSVNPPPPAPPSWPILH